MKILEVTGLTAGYIPERPVVKELSFFLEKGETLGLCGSSGCGKTTVLWAVLGMLSACGGYAEGTVMYNKQNLLSLNEKAWRRIRWRELSLVSQSVSGNFNPVCTIEFAFTETLKAHTHYTGTWREQVCALLESVKLDKRVLKQYPHELSGGMKQRASIALALALNPAVLILDEATNGLDVLTEADILKLLWDLQRAQGLSILFVSHDRRIVQQFCHKRIML